MNTITTLAIPTASLAALRPALQECKAYAKVARYNVDAMREYAAKVAEVRSAGNIEELTADNVDAVLAQVRADAAAKAAADASPVAGVRTSSGRQQANEQAVQALAALGTVDLATFTKLTGKGATYWTASAWTTGSADRQPATWNPIFTACVRLGVDASWQVGAGGARVVHFTTLLTNEAEAVRAELAAGVAAYNTALAARRAARS